MKQRYFIKLSFKGTNYHGWQIQKGSPTVQAILDNDLTLLLNESIYTTGAGRTDTGVHAKKFFAHFDSHKTDLSQNDDFLFKLNRKLPRDIAAHQIIKVKSDAHARYSPVSRTYEYHIVRKKDPFNEEFAHYLYGDLDFETIQKASTLLLRFSDFKSFSKTGTDVRNYICDVRLAEWNITPEHIFFTITADRFLRNMVRAIVGTLLDIGFGRITLEDFKNIVKSRKRSEAGTSVPAKGLFLTDIQYPEDIFID